MFLLDPRNILTGIAVLAAAGWTSYAVLFSAGTSSLAAPLAPTVSSFELKPSKTLEIRALLTTGKIDQLEALLSGLQDRFEAGTLDELKVADAFNAFATSDPGLEGPLNAWNQARPSSFAAALARARYFMNLAWKSRGTAVAARTPPKRFTTMRDYMRRARSDIIRAHTLRPRLIAALPTMIQVVYHLGEPGTLEKPIKKLSGRYPCSALLHWTVLPYLQPKWSGSIAKIDVYTAKVSDRCPEFKGLRAFRDIARGHLELARGNADGAIRRYTKALRHLNSARYYYYRGMVYRGLNRHEKAFAEFSRSFARNQEDIQTLTELAVTLFKRGRKEEALRLWERALALDPYNPEVLIDRALTLIWSDKNPAAWYETAMADLKKALRFGSDLPKIARYWRTAYMRRLGLPDGPAVLRKQYYAHPKDEDLHGLYISTLLSRFSCKRVAEFRTFLKRCPKIGLCKPTNRIYGLELESLIKRHGCS